MATDLTRFGVAMEAELLKRFDARITARGYATRSEALRDLVRADLADAHVEDGGSAVATLTVVYDHHVRELAERLTSLQHALGHHVVSTLHVHLDHDNCLEVIVLRGPSGLIRDAADKVIATKGVTHGRLVVTALPGGAAHPAHSHPAHLSHEAEEGHGHHHGENHSHGYDEHTARESRRRR